MNREAVNLEPKAVWRTAAEAVGYCEAILFAQYCIDLAANSRIEGRLGIDGVSSRQRIAEQPGVSLDRRVVRTRETKASASEDRAALAVLLEEVASGHAPAGFGGAQIAVAVGLAPFWGKPSRRDCFGDADVGGRLDASVDCQREICIKAGSAYKVDKDQRGGNRRNCDLRSLTEHCSADDRACGSRARRAHREDRVGVAVIRSRIDAGRGADGGAQCGGHIAGACWPLHRLLRKQGEDQTVQVGGNRIVKHAGRLGLLGTDHLDVGDVAGGEEGRAPAACMKKGRPEGVKIGVKIGFIA